MEYFVLVREVGMSWGQLLLAEHLDINGFVLKVEDQELGQRSAVLRATSFCDGQNTEI